MLVEKQNIERYIPQRSPIVMIDTLEKADETAATTTFMVKEHHLFVKDNVLQEPGLIENIAQTAAAHAGYYHIEQNLPVPLGFIAAIRNLNIGNLPAINTKLVTRVTITNKVMDVTIVEGKISVNGNVICSCEMRIFIKP